MSNPNRNQKSKQLVYSKQATATCDPEYIQNMKSVKLQSFKRQKKIRTDPVQIALTAGIFIFLAATIYFILGPISVVAMAMGGGLAMYHMFNSKAKMFSKKDGRRVWGGGLFLKKSIFWGFSPKK